MLMGGGSHGGPGHFVLLDSPHTLKLQAESQVTSAQETGSEKVWRRAWGGGGGEGSAAAHAGPGARQARAPSAAPRTAPPLPLSPTECEAWVFCSVWVPMGGSQQKLLNERATEIRTPEPGVGETGEVMESEPWAQGGPPSSQPKLNCP